MSSSKGANGHPHRPQQRPHYVPFSAAQQQQSSASSISKQYARPADGLPRVSSSNLTPSSSFNEPGPSASRPLAPRRSHGSPSAYDRFNEVDWIVDLSSRIGNALQPSSHNSMPASSSAAASPSSSFSHALTPSRSRVRLPRPSREFRELQHRVQLTRGLQSASDAPDVSISSATSDRAEDPDTSAIEWAQHAQSDFERRRADLQHSRLGVLKHLQDTGLELDANEENPGADAEQKVDPAVERSMLTAKSLQELMRSGGLQPEGGEQDFSNLLDNAEPLPALNSELGPSALFEASQAADGSLDIESILRRRAQLVASEDDHRTDPPRPVSSILDLSDSASKSAKRPTIEVLGEASTADAATGADDAASVHDENIAERGPISSNDRQHLESHPMDQIEIVDGTFQIVPAQPRSNDGPFSQNRYSVQSQHARVQTDGEQQLSDGSENDQMDSASDAHETANSTSAAEEDEEDEDEDEDEDDEVEDDEDDEMDDSAEHGQPAYPASQRYHDGFGGVDTRDLLIQGPVGDADEPIVLSDSDDDDDADNASSQRHRYSEEEQDDEAEDDDPDELAAESESESESENHEQVEPDQGDATSSFHHDRGPHHSYDDPEHVPADYEHDGCEAGQESLAPMQRDHARDEKGGSTNSAQSGTRLSDDLMDMHAHDRAHAQLSADSLLNTAAGSEGEGVPDSEVEPEEVDEDLRWPDVEGARQDDVASSDSPSPSRLEPADAAFRARQGSQPMPGFVSAAQIFADIQAAQAQPTDEGALPSSISGEKTGRIDPELLEGSASNQQATGFPSREVASAVSPEQLVPSHSQTESDIFDAFTRQDAASDTHESVEGRQSDADEIISAADIDTQHTERTVAKDSDLINGDSAMNANQIIHAAGSIPTRDHLQQLKEGEAEAELDSDARLARESPVEEVKGEQHIDTIKDTAATGAASDSPKSPATREVSRSPRLQAAEEIISPATVPSSPDRGTVEAVESSKPSLVRVESTDIMEADVEDNSEEEVAPDEAIVQLKSASAPLAVATAAASSDTEIKTEDSRSVLVDEGSADPDAATGIATSGDIGDLNGSASREHIEQLSPQAPEEEGILSGDLADRESSLERQGVPPAAAKPASTLEELSGLDPVMHKRIDFGSDAEAEGSVPALSATTSAEKDQLSDSPPAGQHDVKLLQNAAESNEFAGDETPEVVSAAEPLAATSDVQPADGKRSEGSTAIETKITEESKDVEAEPKEESRAVDAPVAIHPSTLTPRRVPPSPASSDRRSTSSFTPSANRQGNRHLHGAAKRSFFAQVTEAASGLASNLAAPLRALPSLLPISERRAEEMREVDEDTQVAETVDEQAEGSVRTAAQQQGPRLNKTAEPPEFTITTRSHCICRKLQLGKVEGHPVFIVPGCSINYEQARKEGAEDLGPTDESQTDDWLTVDPDFIPEDVHHVLSRVIGLDFLNEGICVEPGSSAAKLVFADDLDANPLASLDHGESCVKEASPDEEESPRQVEVKEENGLADDEKTDEGADLESKQGSGVAHAKAEAMDETARVQEPETPTRATRRSNRHRRASSAASTSSLHRSPRHPDPKSPNADFLPDDERRRLAKDRHPPSIVPGSVSIASLEKYVSKEEAEATQHEVARALQAGVPPEGRTEAFEASVGDADASPQAKKKRGRPRKSVAADTDQTSRLQDVARELGDDVDELLAEPKAKKRRGGRKSSAQAATESTEAQANSADKDEHDAAAVEDELDAVMSTPKRSVEGRKKPQAETALPESNDAEQASTHEEEQDEAELLQGGKGKKGGKSRRKRKQPSADEPSAASSAAATEASKKVPKLDQAESAKAQPRRSRRSQAGTPAQSPSSSSRTSPRKSPKRKVLKLN